MKDEGDLTGGACFGLLISITHTKLQLDRTNFGICKSQIFLEVYREK